MKRVSKNNPCPVCHKPDWCLVAHDGSAAICARIELGSIKKSGNAGWLHVLDYESYSKRSIYHFHICGIKHESKTEMPYLHAQYIAATNAARYLQAFESLGVSVESLKRLQIGWDGQAFCFPMKDVTGEIIGIRRRLLNGKKFCVPGSKTGLFISLKLKGRGFLIIAEGNNNRRDIFVNQSIACFVCRTYYRHFCHALRKSVHFILIERLDKSTILVKTRYGGNKDSDADY